MKYTVYHFINANRPNVKITVWEFYELQCGKDVNCMLPTYIPIPQSKYELKTQLNAVSQAKVEFEHEWFKQQGCLESPFHCSHN